MKKGQRLYNFKINSLKYTALVVMHILSIPMLCHAQDGIQWAKFSNWEEVKINAKKQNKYIFVDCYTTWCAPCKRMEEHTFSKKEVGDFFDCKFISIKLQMDSTKKDDKFIKDWYKDAEQVKKNNYIFSFPTLLFFNPSGELVQKITGFQKDDKFISIAKESLQPGKKYEDPLHDFYGLLEKYNKGIKEYERFPYMINSAKKIGQKELIVKLISELHQHLLSLNDKELLNRNYIGFIAEYENINDNKSGRGLYRIFYPDGKKVDAIMGRDNYSIMALNEMIRRDYVAKCIGYSAAQIMSYTEVTNNKDRDVNWDELFRNISTKFNPKIADLNVCWAKYRYYDFYGDLQKAKIYFIELLKKHGPQALDINPIIVNNMINMISWQYGVLKSNDIVDMKYLAEQMMGVIDRGRKISIDGGRTIVGDCGVYQYIDTYARLLYKIGDNQDAVINQKKAIDIYVNCIGGKTYDDTYQDYSNALSKMEKGLELIN